MKRVVSLAARLGFLALMVGVAATCSDTETEDLVGLQGLVPDGILFFALDSQPNAVMEALYVGGIVTDDAGCLRLKSPVDATVIWPFGSTLAGGGEAWQVLNAQGQEIAAAGEEFRSGGGFVHDLHEGIPLSDADRRKARAVCPGDYWIVGDVSPR